jgi:hypothetical protein
MDKMYTVPNQTRELYRSLRLEVFGIHYRLRVLKQLFTSQEIVDLLNKTAPSFFKMLKIDLLDTVVLMISRLLDTTKTFNKYPNASLQQLIDGLDLTACPELIAELKGLLKGIKTKSERLKYWRDKWTGHRDFDVLLGLASTPKISLIEFDDTLSLIGKFLNEFEGRFYDKEINLIENLLSIEDINELSRLKVYQPSPYEDQRFPSDDGNSIINLINKSTL